MFLQLSITASALGGGDLLTNAPELQDRVSNSLKKPEMMTYSGFFWVGIVSIFHLVATSAYKDLTVATVDCEIEVLRFLRFLLPVLFFLPITSIWMQTTIPDSLCSLEGASSRSLHCCSQ